MRVRLFVSISIFLIIAGVLTPSGQCGLKLVRIGIVKDGLHERFQDPQKIFEREILRLTTGVFDLRFPADKTIQCNWNLEEIRKAVDRLLADPEVDLILGLGFLASNELSQRRNLPKPVVAPIIADPLLQKLPLKDGASGVKNLSYIDPFFSFSRDIKIYREIVPFRHLTVLASRVTLDAIPWLEKSLGQVAHEYTIEVDVVGVGGSVEEALATFSPETDAVYLMPLPHLSAGKFDKLVSELIRRKLPSFSMWGREDVEAGVLASVAPKTTFTQLSRRLALNVQRILLGEDAASLRVAFPLGEKLAINMATARAVGVYPGWSVLTEAELLNDQVQVIQKKYSLASAVQAALAANLDLAVADRDVAAGEQVVKQARSDLLPQIDIESGGVVIDDDRAEAGTGMQPERTVTGTASGSQLIYSDDAWANYTSEQHLQMSREEQRQSVRLDVIRDAAVAYLNVLRAKTLERVEKDNLRLTRGNLERALVRVSTGVANRSEEFRWQSEIANNRSRVLRTEANSQRAETVLNRVVHRPLEERFRTEDAELNDPMLLVSDPRIFTYVDNPRNFRIYRDFITEEGVAVAPELLSLKAEIEAQKRNLTATRRAFYLPTFSVQGEVTEVFAEGGEGKREGQPIDDTDWSVGVFATFPLISGGDKYASYNRASEELSSLNLQYDARTERVGERIRSAMYRSGASYPNIQLSQDAADASNKNLELVTDQYVRGTVSIVDLLDAQNSALVANTNAENSVYDFLVDLMDVQRAAAKFDFFMNPGEREAYFTRAEEFFRKAGIELRKK